MKKRKKWKGALSLAAAVVFLASQLPLDALASQATEVSLGVPEAGEPMDGSPVTRTSEDGLFEADVMEGVEKPEAEHAESVGEETPESSEAGTFHDGTSNGVENVTLEGNPAEEENAVPEGNPAGDENAALEGNPAGGGNAAPEGNPAGEENVTPEGNPAEGEIIIPDGISVDMDIIAQSEAEAMAGREAASGYVDGTSDAVSWSYDQETKTVVVTGTGTRATTWNGIGTVPSSCFPVDTEQIRFENCRLEGSWDYMFKGLVNLVSIDFTGLDMANATSMRHMFSGCGALASLDLSGFGTSQVTSMADMFYGCAALTGLDLGSFDTSQVASMADMFWNCANLASLNLSSFDTSRVTTMSVMFSGCGSLTSLDLGNFNTSQVTTMRAMFSGCGGLTELNLGNFDTGQVTNMAGMFRECTSLANLDLGIFNTEQVSDMEGMFYGCSGLDRLNLGSFNTSQITSMARMFSGCGSLAGLDLGNFDTSQVTDVESMLSGCDSLQTLQAPAVMGSAAITLPSAYSDVAGNQITELTSALAGTTLTKVEELPSGYVDGTNDMVKWTYDPGTKTIVVTGSGTRATEWSEAGAPAAAPNSCFPEETEHIRFENCRLNGSWDYMFKGLGNLVSIDFAGLDMANATSMGAVFYGCAALTRLDLGKFATGQAANMESMFEGCSGLTSLNLEGFDTSRATNMKSMFSGCKSLSGLDLGSFATGQVIHLEGMFQGCNSLTELNLGNFDTSKATGMWDMFSGCGSLTALDLENFDTRQVTDMRQMFYGCGSLTEVNLGSFTIYSGTDVRDMLTGCNSLTKVKSPAVTSPSIDLPAVEGKAWRTAEGEEVISLGLGLKSVWVALSDKVEQEVVRVSNMEELKAALGSDRCVVLADGIYEMNSSLSLSKVGNLTIRAENPGRAEILSHEGGSPVVSMSGCRNVEISGCILGHDVLYDSGCGEWGTVIDIYNCQDIKITGCDLYGCGTIGVDSGNSKNISIENSVIRDCKYKAVDFWGTMGNILITGCVISGNNYSNSNTSGQFAFASRNNTQLENWKVDGCIFLNNRNTQFTNDDMTKMVITNCVTHHNTWESQEPGDYGICLNGLTWRMEGDVLKLGYPLYFEDGTVIESVQAEPLPYSASSLPWKKYNIQSVDKAWEQAMALPAGVKFTPYDVNLALNAGQGSYQLVDSVLPEGLTLSAEGRIGGVPRVNGTFVFTLRKAGLDGSVVDMNCSLEISENTKENFDTYADPGYELVELVPDMYLEDLPEEGNQLMVSRGLFEEFVALYLDGILVTPGVDYFAESGSTRITIMNQTLKRNGAGTHTLAMEFRTVGTNDLRWAAQNYYIAEDGGDEPSGGDQGDNQDGNGGNQGGNGGDQGDNQGGNGGDQGDNQGGNDEDEETGGSPAQEGTGAGGVIIYQVKTGDTLWKIAKQFHGTGRSWRRIYEENKSTIPDPNNLRVGQTLTITLAQGSAPATIPDGSGSAQAGQEATDGGKTYTVETGDTLYKIAVKFYGRGERWNDIYKANRNVITEPKKIYPGQKIIIP